MESNVFLTTLSILNDPPRVSSAKWAEDAGREPLYYYMQQRPGFVFTRQHMLPAGQSFSKIIVLCSEKVLTPDVTDETQKILFGKSMKGGERISAFEAFSYQLKQDTRYDKTGKLTAASGSEPYTGNIVSVRADGSIDSVISEIVRDSDNVNLYVDVQGGSRVTNLLVQAILSVASRGSARLTLRSIVAGEGSVKDGFTYKQVRQDYEILTLVSGMNAFLEYGKADMIQTYANSVKTSNEVSELTSKMVAIDTAISICDTQGIVRSIADMNVFLNSGKTFLAPFDYLVNEIRVEYKGLMVQDSNADVDIPALIKWILKKQFFQQAITLCEAELPKWVFHYQYGKMRYQNPDWNYWEKVQKSPKGNIRTPNFILDRLSFAGAAEKEDFNYDKSVPVTIRFDYILKNNLVFDSTTAYCESRSRIQKKPKLLAFLKMYRTIKDVRNVINHASQNMVQQLQRKCPNSPDQTPIGIMRYCVTQLLDDYDSL